MRRLTAMAAVAILLGATFVVGVATAGAATRASAGRPTISSVSPNQGRTEALQHVIINGQNFRHVNSVYFGKNKALTFDVLGPRTIAAYAPAQSESNRHVRVTTSAGRSNAVPADLYRSVGGFIPIVGLAPVLAPHPSNAQIASTNDDISDWSCGTGGHCVAVGQYLVTTSNVDEEYQALAYTRTDSGITVAAIPATEGGKTVHDLDDVSCAGPDFCAAVGNTEDGNAVVATLENGTWDVRDAPIAPGTSGVYSLNAISCGAAGSCVAVGQDANGKSDALVLTLADGTWTDEIAPQPADGETPSYAHLTDVDCPTSASCEALGDYTNGGGEATYAVADTAGALTATELLDPNGASLPYVDGLDCAAAGHCVASGYYVQKAYPLRGLVEVLDGSSWTAVSVANPADVSYGMFLNGVTCASVSLCFAVGYYDTEKGATKATEGMIVTIKGTSVDPVPAPAPREAALSASEQLFGVTCHSTTSCVAVGQVGGEPLTVVYTHAGVWQPQAMAQPGGATKNASTSWTNVASPSYENYVLGGVQYSGIHGDEPPDDTSFSFVYGAGIPSGGERTS